jgi:S-adenosylmethionine:tRNA ribosyltransferase-isomerase
MTYTINDFDFDLPEELIAQRPAHPRDHARLLVFNRKDGSITDDYFYNIEQYLPDNTSVVVNNSKVEKARLQWGNKEIFVTKTVNDRQAEAMVRPGKKFKPGKKVSIDDELFFTVKEILEDGQRVIESSVAWDDPRLDPYRLTPFPPYIEQDESLAEEYQTVYARDLGSKAAPTAGLHFTDDLMDSIKQQHPWVELTLHVGLGTFAPVKADRIEDHIMHSERYSLSADAAQKLNQAEHITAVGTTSVRVLESASADSREFSASNGDTDIFITPGYEFKNVDSLITNFHLPKSTLLMLVSAFAGFDEMWRIYNHAINERYRFFSFGDGMLLI